MSVWDAREDVEEPRCQASGSPLLHSLRVQPRALHGTNIDARHLVMASPTGVVLMDFWDASDVQNVANATALEEDVGAVAGEKGAIGNSHFQMI